MWRGIAETAMSPVHGSGIEHGAGHFDAHVWTSPDYGTSIVMGRSLSEINKHESAAECLSVTEWWDNVGSNRVIGRANYHSIAMSAWRYNAAHLRPMTASCGFVDGHVSTYYYYSILSPNLRHW